MSGRGMKYGMREVHVISSFDDSRAVEWFAAMDYGFTHYTVVLLGCRNGDGNLFIVDEHAERLWLPQRHAPAIVRCWQGMEWQISNCKWQI